MRAYISLKLLKLERISTIISEGRPSRAELVILLTVLVGRSGIGSEFGRRNVDDQRTNE